MSFDEVHNLILWSVRVLWMLLWAYWFYSAIGKRKPQRTQRSLWYLFHLLMVLPAYLLPYDGLFRVGPLAGRALPRQWPIDVAGMLFTATGLGFAAWARIHLGAYWSGNVTIKDEHRLIRTGPYALVRHPIYTGLATGLIGTGLVIGEWHALAAVIVALLAFARKIRLEEQWLGRHFGEEYQRYRQETCAVIPRIL